MKTCSVCQRCYEDTDEVCVENHGTLIRERTGTRQIVPNYRLDSLIERDTVGEIYLATNVALEQSFVVKIIAQNLLDGAEEQMRQTLQREAAAAAALNHPNIARVHESGWLDSGEFYVVAESVGDKTLQGLLRDNGSLSEDEAVKIARQTAEGLMATHAAGIIHRAVSPANIVLIRNPQNQFFVKLQNFDFGGIKQQITAGKFAVEANIETLRYSSPEQFAGRSVDAQTDVYSLGIVLYEMLCGRSPFSAPTSASIADREIDEQPLTQMRFDVRALLTHIIKESLQKRPAARLQTGNFARQLRHIAQLILPLGENLPTAPQILPLNEKASDAPKLSEPVIEEQSPHEVITLDKIETAVASEPAEQTNVVKTRESAADENFPLGKLAPIFIPKNKAEALTAQLDPAENLNADVDSFNSGSISVEKERDDYIRFESDVEPDENPTNKVTVLGTLAPVFLTKSQSGTDSLPIESVSTESKDLVTDSFELSPAAVENNRLEEIPIESEPIIVEGREFNREPAGSDFLIYSDKNIARPPRAETSAPDFIDYSDETPLPQRPSRTSRSAFVAAGLAAVLISVLLGTFLYNRMQHSPVSEQAKTAAPPAQTASDPTSNTGETAEKILPDTPKTRSSTPDAIEKKPLTASKSPDQPLSKKTITANETARRNEPAQKQTSGEKSSATNDNPQTELSSALSNLISATNSRDVKRQMNYYAPKLNAYYLTRNTSQDAVRAEKNRIFSRADAVDIQTGKPDIDLSPDGQKATMRFRKKYDIKQGTKSRSGEVIQELQWVKSGDGWRIVSERDVKVINR